MTLMQDITPEGDGGVLKEVKTPGPDPNDRPWKGDKVWVHYTGTLENGSKFDSSYDRGERLKFMLGKAEVIKGWDLGVASMARGEVSLFKIKPEYAYGRMGKPPQIPENATLNFEIELLHFVGEDITKDRDEGIMKRTKLSGEGFDHPNDGGTVTVEMIGYYNGQPFETRSGLTFTLGEGEEVGVPRGVELAIEKMKKKEKIEVKLSSKYAFGTIGLPDKEVPPNANVVYEVELLSFDRAKESWQMDAEMKVEQARVFKEKGTEFFVQGKFDIAANKYKKIIDFLEHELSLKGEVEEERKELLMAGRLNLAMCNLKLENWIEARNMCNKVLEDNDNAKAYFRRGEAYFHLKDFELAVRDFGKVLEMDPSNKAAKNKVVICTKEIKVQRKRDKHVFANMFDKFAKIDSKREQIEKGRERPVEIGDWTGDKKPSLQDTLTVQGDIEMDMDLSKAIDEHEAKQNGI